MLSIEAGMQKDLGMLHLDSHLLIGSVEEDLMLMAESLDFLLIIPRSPPRSTLHRSARPQSSSRRTGESSIRNTL